MRVHPSSWETNAEHLLKNVFIYLYQREHQGVLDKAREEYESRLQQAMERIVLLQKEVEKYKTLAGIEKFAQDALSGTLGTKFLNLYTPAEEIWRGT